MTLTIADIERWYAGDVREVFHAASSRAQAAQDAADGLAELPAFTTWGGEAAEAAKDAIGRTRTDLQAHGAEALAVANAARTAADEIERIKSDLATLKADAAALGMEIDPVSGRVVADPDFKGGPMELLLKQQQLQPRVDTLIAEANLIDTALANAIDMASDATTTPPGQAPGDADSGAPKSFEDMLVPTEAREAGDSAAGTPSEILAAGGTTADAEQPGNLDDALTDIAGRAVPVPPDVTDSLIDQLEGKPDDGTPYTQSPLAGPIANTDLSALNRQLAKVHAAEQNVKAAEAALNNAAVENYTAGAGGGPNRNTTDLLTQKLFDARGELTDQRRILEDLNFAVIESGGPGVKVPPLPPNAEVQSLPPEPSKLAEASRALSEGSFGIIPDYAETADVVTNWGEHTGAEQTQALLDIAGSVPLPGGKLVTEAAEHGLDALGVLGRHTDIPTDVTTPRVDVDDMPNSPDVPGIDVPNSAADDIGSVGSYGIEDTGALLTASEASGGHLIEKHVGQTFDDLTTRLETEPLPKAVSTFATTDEAANAVSTTLQHNQSAIESWVSNGADKKLVLTAPFDGGEVLVRGTNETIVGTETLVVLQGNGTGGWYVLTGYMKK